MNEKLLEKILDKLLFSENKTYELGCTKIDTKEEENVLGSENIGKYVILRGYDSGVHFGKLVFAKKGLYRLEDSRRLWGWTAKESIGLSGVAIYGIKESNYTKICPTIPLIEITDDRISEIIPCSEAAIKIIKEFKIFNP